MKIKKYFKKIVFIFFLSLTVNSVCSQNSKYITSECFWCKGKKVMIPLISCSNCNYWTDRQKEYNYCSVCRNKRVVDGPLKACIPCKGKGYTTELNVSENLKYLIIINESSFTSYFSTNEKKPQWWKSFKLNYIDKYHISYVSEEESIKISIDFFDNGNVTYSFISRDIKMNGNCNLIFKNDPLGKPIKYSFDLPLNIEYEGKTQFYGYESFNSDFPYMFMKKKSN
jgi:hypothetical protein